MDSNANLAFESFVKDCPLCFIFSVQYVYIPSGSPYVVCFTSYTFGCIVIDFSICFLFEIGICYLSCVKSSLFDVILFLMIDLHVSFVFLVFCVTLFGLQVLHWSNHEKPKITNTNASSYQCIICSR